MEPPSRISRRALPCRVMTIGGLLMTGCNSQPPVEKLDPDVWRSPHAEFVQHVSTVAVAEGMLPLAYQVASPGVVRVVDENTSKEVAHVSVDHGQIVGVGASKGVEVAGQLLSGPLLASHRYGIYIDIANPEGGPQGSGAEKK